MKTSAVFFPFDLFGHSGTRQGAELLADAVREMLADNRREKMATRARAYTSKVRLHEVELDTPTRYQTWREDARSLVRTALERRDFLLWVSGNHLGVLPVYDELSKHNVVVIQFDAHLDIYNLSDCTTELSHGNFVMHVDGPLPEMINIGHRELLLPPEHVAKFYHRTFSGADLAIDSALALETIREISSKADAVFLDLDCDVFDPAYFPAVAHSVPMGLRPQDVLRFLDAAWSPKVMGCAISEFDPSRDEKDRCLGTLMWFIEWMLLKRYEKRV